MAAVKYKAGDIVVLKDDCFFDYLAGKAVILDEVSYDQSHGCQAYFVDVDIEGTPTTNLHTKRRRKGTYCISLSDHEIRKKVSYHEALAWNL